MLSWLGWLYIILSVLAVIGGFIIFGTGWGILLALAFLIAAFKIMLSLGWFDS